MSKTVSLLLVATLTLSACGAVRDSRVNPFNWFGQSRSVPVEPQAQTNPLIPTRGGLFASAREKAAEYNGSPFDQVTNLTIERIPGGAVIRATGLAARQGSYDVRLTPVNEDEEAVDGVLAYRLERVLPATRTNVGAQPTREVIAARHVTDQMLRGVRVIRVEARRNAVESRR
ncbi:hypothetical protein [uncultured Sulfitobacter sp.]|uniref:hypothetical protein n=1 Tax=uncultured Sulfitobacter sp. TaxID=191468 RepID=UPI0026098596|nr:hypothetical protein [uncultured Sulfitobacter sp.]